MPRYWRSIVVAAVMLATLACDSQRPPTGPSVGIPPSPAREPGPVSSSVLPAPPAAPTSSDPLVGRYALDIAVASSC
ncbi:MAG TPA: hypothetical protein VNJ04_05820, partial [Gemmatimonadaceae bacterium]|nr:hypothetical protein [Gemmatimonadaceae bacterium]